MKQPVVVCCGLGVDSVAILVGLYQRGIVPDLVIFADVGAERQRVSPREEISLSANFMEQAQHLGWCGATETSLPSKLRTKREALIGK